MGQSRLPLRRWVVTDASPNGPSLNGAIVEARDADQAAYEGMRTIYAEHGELEGTYPTSIFVASADDGVFYSADWGAFKVPDEFQCCGGQPHLDYPGTFAAHAGGCPNATEASDA